MTEPAKVSQFITELRQRSVFKVAAAYGVTGWLLIEIVNNVFPVFNFPQWTLQFVILLVLLGFPIALILSWIYEATPEGIKRTVTNEAGYSTAPESTGKLNGYIIVALSVLVIFQLVERVFFAGQGSEPATAEVVAADAVSVAATVATAPAQTITDKSIAVLPLDDFSAGGEEEYFADGLTEEILTALSRTPDLLVAARTSSFQYKDQAVDVQEVAKALGVAHILEGSVRRSADRLRVTVQLIRASDGFHLWSENYDRTPDDIIAVQEDIAFQIAVALQTAMDPEALRQMVQAGTQSIEAYNAYLKGLAIQSSSIVEQQTAYESFELARTIDPAFAAAHYGAAMYWWAVLNPSLIASNSYDLDAIDATTIADFLERISLAIATAKLPERYYYQALEAQVNLQFNQVKQLLRLYVDAAPADLGTTTARSEASSLLLALWAEDRELASQIMERLKGRSTLSPRMMGEMVFLSWVLGDFDSGREFALQAIARYPEEEFIRYQAHRLLLAGGYLDEARALAATITGIQMPAENVQMVKLRQACADGNDAEALRIFDNDLQISNTTYWHVLMHMGRPAAAADYLRPYDQEPYLFSLSTLIHYPYFDITQFPNLQAVLQREGIKVHPFQPFPYTCTTTAQ